jgi:hydroxymethylglutaryl-CoA lyase
MLSFKDKLWFIQSLVKAGCKDIELGAFVRNDRVPSMADTDRICASIQSGKLKLGHSRGWCLVPNRHGLDRALLVGVTHLAVFTAASESFAQKNIGMTIRESLSECQAVIRDAQCALGNRLRVRGYVSTAFGCPFEGMIPYRKTLKVIDRLAELGVDQISIGDTLGVATPFAVEEVIRPAIRALGVSKTAVHFHDTRGTALANVLRSIDLGVRVIDSALGGFGGCPFAPGAAGNLATEDLVYMLNGMKMKNGIDLKQLCKISIQLSRKMKKTITSRYVQSFIAAHLKVC